MPSQPPHEPQNTPADLIIRMENITKRFPGVVANADVHLRVQRGTFHAVIGENGAGKSTLLNILYGRYRPDAGRIFLSGEDVTNALHSPADAIRRGVGLVSQHYALIPALTVLENVMLGAESPLPGGLLQPGQASERIHILAQQLGLGALDVNLRAERLSVAAQQKVEILKALYRGAKILLLDEPTATLAPQEADALFALLHTLAAQGSTIVFVTHKLREVMTHSNVVSVLRAGRSVGDFVTAQTDEQELLRAMIGTRDSRKEEGIQVFGYSGVQERQDTTPLIQDRNSELSSPEHLNTRTPEYLNTLPLLLQAQSVTARNARGAEAVQNVSLNVAEGEIVGIAGVDGSGQRELSEVIVGIRRMETGRLFFQGVDISRQNVRSRQQQGIAYIPEDRHRAGMVMDFSVAENYLLGHERETAWGGGIALHPKTILSRAAQMIPRYDVRAGERGAIAPGRALSGGNQQKVVFARAMDSRPRLLVACQPTRGLDVEASRFVYETLLEARSRGLGVLLFSLDLDEVLRLSDRIAVMFNGQIAGVLTRDKATPETHRRADDRSETA